jgi:hypothetical protein
MHNKHLIFYPIFAAVMVIAIILYMVLPFQVIVSTQNGFLSLGISRNQVQATTNIQHIYADGSTSVNTTIQPDGIITQAPYALQINMVGMPGFTVTDKQKQSIVIALASAKQTGASVLSSTANISPPVLINNTATWYNLYTDVDVVLTANGDGVYLNRIIKSANAPLVYSMNITQTGNGRLVVPSEPPPAVDAKGQQIQMTISPTAAGRTETLTNTVLPSRFNTPASAITYPIVDAISVLSEPLVKSALKASSANVTVPSGATFCVIYISEETTSNTACTMTLDSQTVNLIEYDIGSGSYDGGGLYYTSGFSVGSNKTFSWSWNSQAPGGGATYELIFFSGVNLTTPVRDHKSQVQTNSSQTTTTTPTITSAVGDLIVGGCTDGGGNSPDMSSGRYAGQTQLVTPGAYNNDGYDAASKAGASPTVTLSAFIAGGYIIACSLEATASGSPDISNTPASLAFGTLYNSQTYWSNNLTLGYSPTWALTDAECYFTVTNNGTISGNITASATNFTGGITISLTDAAPGSTTARLSLYRSGDAGISSNTTLSNSARAFISNLAASATEKWEIKLETPTSNQNDGVSKTCDITFTISSP